MSHISDFLGLSGDQMGGLVREALRDAGLSQRSPGYGARTAPQVPPATPREQRNAMRQARREAVLGRASSGTPGDVDLPDAGVAESPAMERLDRALQLRETTLQVAEQHEAVHGHRPPQAAAMLAMADREVATARAAAGLLDDEDDGPDGDGLREAIPGLDEMLAEDRLDRQEREGSGPYADSHFRTWLRESGGDVDDESI